MATIFFEGLVAVFFQGEVGPSSTLIFERFSLFCILLASCFSIHHLWRSCSLQRFRVVTVLSPLLLLFARRAMFPSMPSAQVFALLIGFACISCCSGADTLAKPVDVPVVKPSKDAATPSSSKRLTEDTMSQRLRKMEYAVRGKVVIKADEISEHLAKHDADYPFDHIVYTNIGNPHCCRTVSVDVASSSIGARRTSR
jgi:hypothetical protein